MHDPKANSSGARAGEHPKDQTWEPEDPMLLEGSAAPGEPEVMLQCLVEEYARLGWTTDRIADLFDRPFFQATYDLGRRLGRQSLRSEIDEIVKRTGVLRFRTVHAVPVPAESPDCEACEHSSPAAGAANPGGSHNG